MFTAIINDLIISLNTILGKKYKGFYRDEKDDGIDTGVDHRFFIQENERKEKSAQFDKRTRLFTDTRYFDLIIQYRSDVRDEILEETILEFLLKEFGDVTYITDRKYLFNKLTNQELKTEIQIILFTFAMSIRTIKP